MKSSRVVPQQTDDEDMVDADISKAKPVTSEKLWVEKYQPKGYRDLLSDEVVLFLIKSIIFINHASYSRVQTKWF